MVGLCVLDWILGTIAGVYLTLAILFATLWWRR